MSSHINTDPEPKHRWAAMASSLAVESEHGGTQIVLRAKVTADNVDDEGVAWVCAEVPEDQLGFLIDSLQIHQRLIKSGVWGKAKT